MRPTPPTEVARSRWFARPARRRRAPLALTAFRWADASQGNAEFVIPALLRPAGGAGAAT
jgi:hypothetical protein